jgi:hypothetical protein
MTTRSMAGAWVGLARQRKEEEGEKREEQKRTRRRRINILWSCLLL